MIGLNERILQYCQNGFFGGHWQLDGSTPEEALLGVGVYGHVYGLVSDERDPLGKRQTAAIKIIPIDEESLGLRKEKSDAERQLALNKRLREVEDEIAIMQRVKGASNIAYYRDSKKVERTDTQLRSWDVLILMDRLITLKEFLKQSPAKPGTKEYLLQTLQLWRHISSALHVCENAQIIHADVKPANILYHELHEEFKLSGFGVSIPSSAFKRGVSCGTVEYMSPEMYNREGGDCRSDMYSLAVMIYEMLNDNRLPLQVGMDRKKASLERLSGKISIPPIARVPTIVNAALLKCLERDPEERYSSCREMSEAVLELYVKVKNGADANEDARNDDHKNSGNKKWILAAAAFICVIGLGFGIGMGIFTKTMAGKESRPEKYADSTVPMETNPEGMSLEAVPMITEKPVLNLTLDAERSEVTRSGVTIRGNLSVRGEVPSEALQVTIDENVVDASWEEGEDGYAFTATREMNLDGVKELSVQVLMRENDEVAAAQQIFALADVIPAPEPTDVPPSLLILTTEQNDGPSLMKSAFNGPIERNRIATITFADALADVPADAWDISANGDGSVMAWATPNHTPYVYENAEEWGIPEDGFYDLTIAGKNGVQAPESCRNLFSDFCALRSIRFNGCFDTSSVTDMGYMFNNCHSLIEVNASMLDTINVEDMQGMFTGCASLLTLDVSGMNTAHVGDMSRMFCDCEGLQRIVFSTKFDTSNVTDMSSMFENCRSLGTLELSGFHTEKVKTMANMFSGCAGLKELDLQSFNTKRVTDMGQMFLRCVGLEKLDFSQLDTRNVTNMSNMFKGCNSLTAVALPDRIDARSVVSSSNHITMKRGDEGESVEALQKQLVVRNYLWDCADGVYGEKTEIAIEQAQRDAGLPETGIADPITQDVLMLLHHEYEPQAENQLLLYGAEYDAEESTIHVYFKNMGRSVITGYEYDYCQCDAAKNHIGDFEGHRNTQRNRTTHKEWDIWIEPGGIWCEVIPDFYDGYQGTYDNGEVYTRRFFDDGRYARFDMTSFTTEDGATHNINGKRVYVSIR